jgi:hypothetical protein
MRYDMQKMHIYSVIIRKIRANSIWDNLIFKSSSRKLTKAYHPQEQGL